MHRARRGLDSYSVGACPVSPAAYLPAGMDITKKQDRLLIMGCQQIATGALFSFGILARNLCGALFP
jgi:hypothetical protein